MSEKPNDSPAFRLRPRAEPKSYYSIRLEYSANPAAFTRERPRSSGAKRRSGGGGSSKSSYSKSKQHCKSSKAAAAAAAAVAAAHRQGALHHLNHDHHHHHSGDYEMMAPPLASPIKQISIVTKEDLEREERHKLLKREIARSITSNTMISPFMQRIAVDELKPASVYEQNYITLRIEKVIWRMGESQPGLASHGANKLAICRCYEAKVKPTNDEDSLTEEDEDEEDTDTTDAPAAIASLARLNVQLHNEYASERLLKSGKIMNIAKFKTGLSARDSHDRDRREITGSGGGGSVSGGNSPASQWINFDVIVRYDPATSLAPCSVATGGGAEALSGPDASPSPLIPFVSITDMIEQPTEPYVEMAPPSPPPPSIKSELSLQSRNSHWQQTPARDSSATYSTSDTSTNTISSTGSSSASKSTIIIDSPDGHVTPTLRNKHSHHH